MRIPQNALYILYYTKYIRRRFDGRRELGSCRARGVVFPEVDAAYLSPVHLFFLLGHLAAEDKVMNT